MEKGRWRLLGGMGEGKMKLLLGEIMEFLRSLKERRKKRTMEGARRRLSSRENKRRRGSFRKKKTEGEMELNGETVR